MPHFRCRICGKFVQVFSKEWYYVHYSAVLPCSKKCMVDWVYKQKGLDPNRIDGASVSVMGPASKIYDARTNTFYRSRYERCVAEALIGHGIDFRYEAWTFVVGKGIYTPDFYLPLYRCFLEVKGRWTLSQKTKHTKFLKIYGATVPIMVIPWFIREDFGFEEQDQELDFTTFLKGDG